MTDFFPLRYKTAVHQCEVCKKEFKGKSSLEMHFRTHSGKEANELVESLHLHENTSCMRTEKKWIFNECF